MQELGRNNKAFFHIKTGSELKLIIAPSNNKHND
jgi:hypothetical protein